MKDARISPQISNMSEIMNNFNRGILISSLIIFAGIGCMKTASNAPQKNLFETTTLEQRKELIGHLLADGTIKINVTPLSWFERSFDKHNLDKYGGHPYLVTLFFEDQILLDNANPMLGSPPRRGPFMDLYFDEKSILIKFQKFKSFDKGNQIPDN